MHVDTYRYVLHVELRKHFFKSCFRMTKKPWKCYLCTTRTVMFPASNLQSHTGVLPPKRKGWVLKSSAYTDIAHIRTHLHIHTHMKRHTHIRTQTDLTHTHMRRPTPTYTHMKRPTHTHMKRPTHTYTHMNRHHTRLIMLN